MYSNYRPFYLFSASLCAFRHTEDSHVKTSLVHTLYRVKKYGVMPLEMFNELLSPIEILKCQMNQGRRSWYSLTVEVFTAFIFRVSILFLFSIISWTFSYTWIK